MKCDDVFEILTRGPFPSSGDDCQHDAEVERHLAECEECAQLARALQPALDLFHEALDPEEAAELPEYWGQLIAEDQFYQSALLAGSSGGGQVSTQSQAKQERITTDGRIITSVFVLSAMVASMFLTWVIWDQTRPSGLAEVSDSPATTATNAAWSHNPNAWQELQDLGITLACREIPAETPSAKINSLADFSSAEPAHHFTDPSGAHLQCCTACHATDRPGAYQVEVAVLTKSCAVCHSSIQ